MPQISVFGAAKSVGIKLVRCSSKSSVKIILVAVYVALALTIVNSKTTVSPGIMAGSSRKVLVKKAGNFEVVRSLVARCGQAEDLAVTALVVLG